MIKIIIIEIKFIIKINKLLIKLITPKKCNMKNNKQDINKLLLKEV